MNKQSIISRWLSLLLLMMLTGVESSWAQMLSIADFSMAAGDTKEVTVSLTPNASQKIYGIQADISVSEGLSLTEVVSAQKKLDVFKNASSTKLVQFSLSGAEIAAGEVIKLTVQAAKSFTGGTIKIENMRFTDDNTTGHELVIDGVAVANVTVEEAEQWVTLTFDAENSGAQGVAPAAKRVIAGDEVRIPANTSLYIEGKTLAGWFIGSNPETLYKPGDDLEVNEDMRIIPKFTDNTVSFADRTTEVTAIWDFQQQNGAVAQGIEGGKGIVVTQITINNKTIDFPLNIDATSGKYNNESWQDWAQVNNGTKFMLPACKGAVFSTFSMNDNSGTTFNGENGTFADNVNTYNYNGSGNDMTINIQGGSYYRWLKAVYPVPSTEPAEFVFRDFQIDLRDANGGILTADEAANSQTVNFGITVDENNTVTRVEADAENTAAVVTGLTGNNHGLQRFSATVPVEGPVQITMSTCSWGGDVTVKNAEGETVATFTTKKGEGGSGCYGGNGLQDDNIISAKYVGDATTLTISGGAYVGFFAVQAIEASSVEVAYSLGNVECQGDIVPTGGTYANGDQYTIPAKNFTLYKEGYTLTGWTDGENTYATGETITLAGDLNLTPVFTQNEVTLADRTEPVTLKFDFQRKNGAPTVQWEGKTGLFWVTQATVNGKTIDVKADLSTSPGKMANANWDDWAQLNNGTTFTIPSAKGATVTIESYSATTTTTIDGQTDYTAISDRVVSYEIANSAETIDIVIGDGSYFRYIQTVLPVVQSQGGESFDNKQGTIYWTVGNEEKGSISPDIEAAISAATVSAGSEMTVELAKYFDTDMVKYTPANSNAGTVEGVMIEYRVKPKAGVTFKPTSVSYAAVKVGTDGATYSWSYVLDGKESTITQVDAATKSTTSRSESSMLSRTVLS